MASIVEQIDRRLAQIYFETGLKVVMHRWLPWEHYEILLKPHGLELRGTTWIVSSSATKRTNEESTTQ